MFYREKKIEVGNYLEVDIIPRTKEAEEACKKLREPKIRKKRKISKPSQQNLNHKNSKRYMVQLLNGNFSKQDYHITATYDDDHLPETVEAAEREAVNYLRRIDYKRKKENLEALKYVLITEYSLSSDESITRVHHHIIVNGGLTRDTVEDLWCKGRGKKRKKIGFVNADRLQPDKNMGLEALGKYVMKNMPGKKRWSSSRNLKRPYRLRDADHKYRPKQIEKLVRSNDLGYEEFAKKYPKHHIVEIRTTYFDRTGWHVYLKLWKIQLE